MRKHGKNAKLCIGRKLCNANGKHDEAAFLTLMRISLAAFWGAKEEGRAALL